MQIIKLQTENDVLSYLTKNSNKVTINHVVIWPEAAQTFIDISNIKRTVRKSRVNLLAKSMIANHWHLINNGIALDENCDFIDGQHRMLAVIKAETPQEFYLHTGLKAETKAVIDTGAARTFADTLKISGYTGHGSMTTIGAAVRILYVYKTNPEVLRTSAKEGRGNSIKYNIPHDTLLDFTDSLNKEHLWNASNRANTSYTNVIGVNKSSLTAVYYISAEQDIFKSESFSNKISYGENLKKGDPELTLRNGVGRSRYIRNTMHFLLYLKAWDKSYNSNSMHYFTFNENEKIPQY